MMRRDLMTAMAAAVCAPAYRAPTPEAEREGVDCCERQPEDREPSKWAQDRRKAINAKRIKRGQWPE